MVKIRLRRMGAKKAPFYRVVVADSRSPRDGRFIEEIGIYDPTKHPAVVSIDKERAAYWIKNGAQPTDTVRELLKKEQQTGTTPKKKTAPAPAPQAAPEDPAEPAAEPEAEPAAEAEPEAPEAEAVSE